MGFRANGRVPHSVHNQQRQPATMQQLANMSDKQFARAMKPATPKQRAQVDVDQLSQMDDATFNEMFESMKQANGNRFGLGD
ncbi:hypothetical protein D9M71_631150 [compost metagenome]